MVDFVKTLVAAIRTREEGQTFVEYGLVIAGVSIALIGVYAGLAGALGGVMTKITTAIGV